MAEDPQMSANGDNTGMSANADTPLPTTAPAAPPLPTSPAAAPPAATPPPKVASAPQEQPEAPGSHFRNLSHALQGAVLGALAGGKRVLGKLAGPSEVVDGYDVDSSGKMTPKTRQLHTGDRLKLMAQAALEGLAAGSRVPPQKSAGASWAAGIGAGADAQKQQGQQQDLLKRQQAQENYELQQKTQLHKATVAMTNATTHSTWQKIEDDENAKDTERQKNLGIVNSLNDYVAQNPQSGLSVQTMSEQEALAMREADKHTAANHMFLPIGKTQAKDADGKPVFEADGITPKFTKQFAAIKGAANEQIPLPQGILDDAKKYAKFDPRLKSFADVPAGTMIPVTGLMTAYKYATEDKGKEADGWKDAEGKNAVTVDGKLMQHNPYTMETRAYAGGIPLGASKTQAEIADKQADAFKKTAEGKKALEEASGEGPRVLAKDLYQNRLTPAQLAKRKPEYQSQVLREADILARADGLSGFDFEKAQRDWHFADNIGTQNQLKFLNSLTGQDNQGGNLQKLIDISDKVKRTSFPALNDVAAWARLAVGDVNISAYRTTALEVADQAAKILQGGTTGNGTSDAKLKQAADMFDTAFSKDVIKNGVALPLRTLLGERKKGILGVGASSNAYLLKDYGPPLVRVTYTKPDGTTETGTIARERKWEFKEQNPTAKISEIE